MSFKIQEKRGILKSLDLSSDEDYVDVEHVNKTREIENVKDARVYVFKSLI